MSKRRNDEGLSSKAGEFTGATRATEVRVSRCTQARASKVLRLELQEDTGEKGTKRQAGVRSSNLLSSGRPRAEDVSGQPRTAPQQLLGGK